MSEEETESTQPSRQHEDLKRPASHPGVNRPFPISLCREKIVICLDLSKDINEISFKLGDGTKLDTLQRLIKVVRMFVSNKSEPLGRRHEFALCAPVGITIVRLNSAHSIQLCDFKSDPTDLVEMLKDLVVSETINNGTETSVNQFLSTIGKHVRMSPEPDYIIRAILICTRSTTVPQINVEGKILQKLREWPGFFLDVLYVHPYPAETNEVQKIFESLCQLGTDDSFLLETASLTKLHDHMAELLIHPYLRQLP